MYDFPWTELDVELDEYLTEEDTGAEVRRRLSAGLYRAFLTDYAELVRVEIWGPDSLMHAFQMHRDTWLGAELDKARYLRSQLAFGFGMRQEIVEVS